MNVRRLFHTVRHLRFEQWYYRFYYKIKHKLYRYTKDASRAIAEALLFPTISFCEIGDYQRYNPASNIFTFLNQSYTFEQTIDWNFSGLGKLWTYNLNYFEWLNDERLTVADRLKTITDYTESGPDLLDGLESYPISLRGIHWIKFLAKNGIKDHSILACLYRHYDHLAAFPEYQLQANHLLENGFSLLFGAHYFNDRKFYQLAYHILSKELKEQLLNDGGHYELSPMYHCIILNRLLECIELTMYSNRFIYGEWLEEMRYHASRMLGWLSAFIFSNGEYAMMGDAAPGIAPTTASLFHYADKLKIPSTALPLKQSGYRKITGANWEMVLDIGNIMPAYQPGHAHADTFSFCLQVNDMPLITDTGISTYNKNERRIYERSTQAHNTVVVNNVNSTDVWGGFRTGKRAKVTEITENAGTISASHNGYVNLGVTHRRTFDWEAQKITIKDELIDYAEQNALLYLHFHPDVSVEQLDEETYRANGALIKLNGCYGATLQNYLYCSGYNLLVPALRLQAHIKGHTTVTFEL